MLDVVVCVFVKDGVYEPKMVRRNLINGWVERRSPGHGDAL